MREILFRGKRLQGGNWVEGYFFKSDINKEEHESGKATPDFTPDCDTFIMVPECHDRFMVVSDTVEQYTGLNDKNGKRIFEGDIVVFSRGRNLPNAECLPELIKYHQGDCAYQRFPLGRWRYYTKGGSGLLIQPDMMDSCEVVGNVHDNPELLDARRCFECLNGAKNESCTIYEVGYSCGYQQIMKRLQQSAEKKF